MLRQVVCPYVRATQLYLLAKVIIFHQFSTFLCLLFEGQQGSKGVEYIRQLWKEYHLPGEVTDLTPSCNSITFSSADGTKEWQCLHEAKGLEIAEWLRLNAKEPYHYVILDDEEDILFNQREHLVKVDGSKGLDKADVRVAIQILNTKEISQMKRWFYGALKFIALYILMVMVFMAYVYWYPGNIVMNTNRHFLMIQKSLHQYHFPWQK